MRSLTLERAVLAGEHVTAAVQLVEDRLDAGQFSHQTVVVAAEHRVLGVQVLVASLQVSDQCLGGLQTLGELLVAGAGLSGRI